MGIRDLNIEVSYAGKGDVILKEFLLPAIKEATAYDRVTSYYTVESLLAISQGIQSLYEKNGHMRLIIGIHSFPRELVDASLKQKYLDEQIEQVRSEVAKGIVSVTDSLEKERLATIAWMIQDKLLQVKAASVRGEGIFHPKTLLLSDANGDKIAAIGSPNETGSGLGANYEQIMVAKSWEAAKAVQVQELFFENLWNGTDEDAIVSDISEDTAAMILNALGDAYHRSAKPLPTKKCEKIIETSSKMLANFFVSGDIPALYMHQERAVIDALSRWPVRVLFSDEVGLGKTFEVAATMTYLMKYCGIRRVVILTPKSVLQQWQDELHENFLIDAWLYDSAARTYVAPGGKSIYVGTQSPLGRKSPDIVLMSAQLARGSKSNGSVFDMPGTVLPELLIVDEAHSARVSQDIGGDKKPTRMYKMLESVARKIPHLILATATPMQKDADEYHAMLKLLGLPKIWQKKSSYQTSLRLIESEEVPDTSDAYNAGNLLLKTIKYMEPDKERLNQLERTILDGLIAAGNDNDSFSVVQYVQEHWDVLRSVFIKMHPAQLLTVRNTRRSLEQVGYKFPKRNLIEESIEDSMPVQLFYSKVNDYLSGECFSVEKVLYPECKRSMGFVRISYQQRVASSLYSCKKSLEHRLEKINELKERLDKNAESILSTDGGISSYSSLDDLDLDEQFVGDLDDAAEDIGAEVDLQELRRAVGIESTALTSLIQGAEKLIKICGDMKIYRSIQIAQDELEKGSAVLLFSRYTDTIDALLNEFKRVGGMDKWVYGIYTGNTAKIVEEGREEDCNKNQIKAELFSGRLKVMFCSDAASEGLNLQAARVLINVDVPWTPSRLEQRIGRVARLGQVAETVNIYNVWYPYSVEARMYHRIQKRLEQANLAIGEFPEVVATNIKLAILDNMEDEKTGADQLKEIRNSYQTAALEKLWTPTVAHTTISESIRKQLVSICDKYFETADTMLDGRIKVYKMPDGENVGLTSKEGMQESISLKSLPWQYIDFDSDDIQTINDTLGNVAMFATASLDEPRIIRYDTVLKVVLDQTLSDGDYLIGYPQTLAKSTRLNLRYATDCDLVEPPEFWPDSRGE